MEEDLKRNQNLAKEYQELLYPEGYLIAAKLFRNQEEIEALGLGAVKHADGRNTFCQLLSQARYIGRSRLVGADEQACYGFGDTFGMKEMPKEAWKRYVGWQFKTEEAARRAFEVMPRFPVGTYTAIFISPLQRCSVAPDVVVFCGNAGQMLAVLAGYLVDKGGTFTMESNNMSSCGAVIVAPMLDKRPKIVIPGNPWRLLAMPNTGELACGIPGDMLESMAENIRFLKIHGGSQYPPAWQHTQWEPQAPIGDLLKPDGFPSWIQRP